jgi:Polysaccharide deacetylase
MVTCRKKAWYHTCLFFNRGRYLYCLQFIPSGVFAKGSLYFFAIPYGALTFGIALAIMPKLWVLSKEKGYIIASDFIKVMMRGDLQTNNSTVSGVTAFPTRLAIINFDDGYRSQFTNAKPILDKYGFKATFFIVSNFVGKSTKQMNSSSIVNFAGKGVLLL